MSHGHNAIFNNDPLAYIQVRSVNNLTWFGRAAGNLGELAQLNNGLGNNKFGFFDLKAINMNTVEFAVVGPGAVPGDAPISAYWCPFIQGGGLPGWVDIPKRNPPAKFVFTAAMNGCRLVITNRSHTHFRVYHHQHPDGGGNLANGIWNAINQQGHDIIAMMGFDEYGNPDGGIGHSPNAFNFLYYRNSCWNFVSQPQTFDMATLAVNKLPNRAFLRSIQ